MIGSEYSPHSLNQSDYILNPTATPSLVFSRGSGSLLIFTLFLSFLSDIFLYLIEHRVLEWFFVFDTQSKSA